MITPAQHRALQLRAAELLDRARLRITPKGALTRGTLARDAEGNAAGPDSRRAVAWCPLGALARERIKEPEWWYVLGALTGVIGAQYDIAQWSDSHPKRAILAAMRQAANDMRGL